MAKRNFDLKTAVVAGGVAGIVSGFVKLGWEALFPPRTAERDATNPPQQFLQQLGVPEKITHSTYTYSGHQLPWVSFLMHFGFSSSFGILYTVAGHYLPIIKLGQGTFFGAGVWATAHLGALPMLGTVPSAKDQPAEEHLSELFGHVSWMWVTHIVANELMAEAQAKVKK
ncbi:YagU family protein [Liquorilactobacillus sicerae]|uniref:YagU family protein n=1 Tax=Liquorilactobacillus sicerae TaxID=1416943 RepID=UPI0024802B41|nr:DUF1440 domain-containing protein [Liquorilactobacillus sicerae]